MSDQVAAKNCPDPSVHGNPFLYCPYCDWMEPREVHAETLVDQWTRRALAAEAALDAIEAMLVKKKRMGTLFDVQQIRGKSVSEARMTASDAIDDAMSHHMLRRINSTQARCDCGQTFPLSANPHLLSGEMMWHLRDVILDALSEAR